jgi:hypothetical protein
MHSVLGTNAPLRRLIRVMTNKTNFKAGPILILIGSLFSARAQELSIPDSGLDTAIFEALQKLTVRLTAQTC